MSRTALFLRIRSIVSSTSTAPWCMTVTVRAIIRNAAKQDYKISAFAQGIVDSPAFQMSKVAPVETTDAPPAPPAGQR